MKNLIALLVGMIGLSGCATVSIHDYCQTHLEHYKDYNECYQERHEEIVRREARRQSYENSQPDSLNCTSQVIGNRTETSCH